MKSLNSISTALELSFIGQIDDMYDKQCSEKHAYPMMSKDGDLSLALKDGDEITSYLDTTKRSGNSSPNSAINEYINGNILEVDSNIEHFMNFSNAIYDENILKLYGVLIVYGEVRLNPYHPFIAKAIIEKEIILPKKFKLIVYQLKIEHGISIGTFEKDLKTIALSLNSFKDKNYTEFSSRINSSKRDVFLRFIQSTKSSSNPLGYSYTKITEGNVPRNVLIPVQKMGTGITYPYYGLIGCKYSAEQYQSINMYPFSSGNISSVGHNRYGSTCTGSLPNSQFGSLRVLNDMKISSMHHSDCFPSDWQTFVLTCQVSSITILREFYNGEKETEANQTKEGKDNDSNKRVSANSNESSTNKKKAGKSSFTPPF